MVKGLVKDFVWWAGVASRAHLTYGTAWIRRQVQLTGEPLSLRMMGSRTFFGGQEITPDDVAAELEGLPVDVEGWDGRKPPKDARLWMLSTGAVGIKPYLRLRAKTLRLMHVIVLDEGIGTYGNLATRKQAMRRQGVKEPWLSVRAAAVASATEMLTSARWPLHVKEDGVWALNRHIADEFRRRAPSPDRSADRAVFLSQPWPELGVMSEDRYAEHVAEVARAAESAGLEFAVLPHPGEPSARHTRWRVTSDDTLAEFNPVALGARVLLGASSTAMLNLASIHGIPALRVGTPELTQLDHQLAPDQASLLGQYAAPNLTPPELGRRLSQGFAR